MLKMEHYMDLYCRTFATTATMTAVHAGVLARRALGVVRIGACGGVRRETNAAKPGPGGPASW